ncbi:MAG: hypothetical protein HY909_14490 [Deltaproteobacteria bacterium]|nr:hypothetical protein [Deltaproteobacteria bacterium]
MGRRDDVLARVDPRGFHLWGKSFLRSLKAEKPDPERPVNLYVTVADHFEPRWRKPTVDEERHRVDRWVREYPGMARRHLDAFGKPHVRTLFFPEEEYRKEHLDALGSLVKDGLVDVEVHLHHDKDNADNLRRTLLDFTRTLHEGHGLLRRDPETGKIQYAFIHGNWALDNSHPEGIFCGVDNELGVLVETGCYLDMTFPSVPSPTQAKLVNVIYYARGSEGGRRGADTGRVVSVGTSRQEGELMLLPGPLGVHLGSRVAGVIPRIEAAMIEPGNPVPLEDRVQAWVRHAPAVKGAPNHRFIKLHAHGCNGDAPDYFLTPGGPFDQLLGALERHCADARRYVLRYVTAREMYETVKALEAGTLPNAV